MAHSFNFADLQDAQAHLPSTAISKWANDNHDVPWTERRVNLTLDHRTTGSMNRVTSRILHVDRARFGLLSRSTHAHNLIEHEYKALARIDGGDRAPSAAAAPSRNNAQPATASATPLRDNTPDESMTSSMDSLPSMTTGRSASPGSAEPTIEMAFNAPEAQRALAAAVAGTAAPIQCCFYFLGCGQTFSDFHDWTRHCTAHLGAGSEPRSVKCNIRNCPQEQSMSFKGFLHHLAQTHHSRGQPIADCVPVASLLQYLYQRKIITSADMRHIGATGNLAIAYGRLQDQHDPKRELRQRDNGVNTRSMRLPIATGA